MIIIIFILFIIFINYIKSNDFTIISNTCVGYLVLQKFDKIISLASGENLERSEASSSAAKKEGREK